MKKVIYLFVAAIMIAACSSEPHYTIKAKIEGSDTITFYLQKREAGKYVSIDSAVSKNGSFTLKSGKIEYPQMVQLAAGETRKRVSFYLENSEITITGTLDSLFKAKVTGSTTQDEYQKFIDSNKPLSDKYAGIYNQYQEANRAGDAAKSSEIEKQLDGLQKEMGDLQKNFVKENPKSYVTPSILSSLAYEMEANDIEAAINAMDTAVAAIPAMKSLMERAQVMKAVGIGQKAPDFTLNDVDGKPVALSSKIGAKLLLVDFWASWCVPCRQENPNVVKVYKEFNKKGFDVFGVSLDQSKDEWVKAIADDNLTWTHVFDLQDGNKLAAKLYAVNAIPSNFLLDETGTIIARNLRAEDLYNKVNEILGAKK